MKDEAREAIASRWMKRGLALLNENTDARLTVALRCFERVIALRQTLSLSEVPWSRYLLAGSWMNRADVLTRLSSERNFREAVRSYDEALRLLETLELESHALFRQRMAIAWMNRGDVLLRLTPAEPIVARGSAREALRLVSAFEEREVVLAEVGLKARHVFCRAVALESMDTLTDAVEDALQLAAHWAARGETRFRALASDLLRLGARAYRVHQPHFLGEFLLEHVRPGFFTAQSLCAVEQEIDDAFRETCRRSFHGLNTPRFQGSLRTIGDLRRAKMRLAEIRLGSAGFGAHRLAHDLVSDPLA
jgi:hypothetical protein